MADEDDWESKEFDIEPTKEAAPVKRSDKWDGEDEEEPVKDNWDDEEAEEASTASGTSGGTKVEKKNKKRLIGKIAEKEKEQEEKRLQKLRATMTPAELEAEKLKQLKLQEEAELQMVKQAFGAGEIDTADPITKDDFDELRKKIITELRKFEKRTPFEDFVEDFVQDLCLSLPAKRLKKVKTNVEALYHEKSKAEKEKDKPAKASKAKVGKAKLMVDDAMTTYAPDDLEDFDDFM
ncbi:Eukaryotic translation initiation factor 3 subunit J [Orchesella cincta]|uniref:Eukaryotic translation initiation factor 3 subunit J n=1 Tax=Orchesella cincta TaxID=48709 RepID=A0A1D2MNU4_ORCCI|nr:Eukaryotic translation initiation factor 3 subunit J [Orchesella cincta]